MKTLDQVEPRVIINSTNTPGNASSSFRITVPGSYYLAGNFVGVSNKNGIEIASFHVTVDLNGFAMTGPSGSVAGILINGQQANVTVKNGTLAGWQVGVSSSASNSANIVLEGLNLTSNQNGILANGPISVSFCNVQASTSGPGIGLFGGVVSHCLVRANTGNGIAVGFNTQSAVVSDCVVAINIGNGILVGAGRVTNCFVSGNGLSGIYVDNTNGAGSEVSGNDCRGNNTTGNASHANIYVNDSNARIEGNYISGTNTGISVSSSVSNNIIIRNSAIGSGANNYLTPGPGAQVVGPIVNSTGTISSNNPWANFSY